MISISWDPGQALSVLDSLRDAKLAALASKAAAETYTDQVLDYIQLGKSFRSKTGQTEQSIGWRPEGDGAVVRANAETALYLEEGTGLYGPKKARYPIRPKPGGGRKFLRIPVAGGGYLFRKLVMHPGIQAKPFFFADFEAREEKMAEAVRGVIARKLGA